MQAQLPALRKSERKVAAFILQNPGAMLPMRISALAREAGATVIGLVPRGTPLADLCDFPIHINVDEDEQVYTPVSSRIAHLVVIDVLAMGVARYRSDLLKDHLKRLNRSLRTLRVPGKRSTPP